MNRNENIESLKMARRRRVAEEISDAFKASGMTRKEFAAEMHRQPSEVTKWLSGKHNFTCDLLEEISSVLGVQISGAERNSTVCGYGANDAGRRMLNEPSECGIYIELQESVLDNLRKKAAENALTLREYVNRILSEKSEERTVSIIDLCGACPDFPSAREIRSMRTKNTIPDIY